MGKFWTVLLVVFASVSFASQTRLQETHPCAGVLSMNTSTLLFPALDDVEEAMLVMTDYLGQEPKVTLLDSGEVVFSLVGPEKEIRRGARRLESLGYIFEFLNDEEISSLRATELLPDSAYPAPLIRTLPSTSNPEPLPALHPASPKELAPIPFALPSGRKPKVTHELRLVGGAYSLPADTQALQELGVILHQARVIQEPLDGQLTQMTVFDVTIPNMALFPRVSTLPRFVALVKVLPRLKRQSL